MFNFLKTLFMFNYFANFTFLIIASESRNLLAPLRSTDGISCYFQLSRTSRIGRVTFNYTCSHYIQICNVPSLNLQLRFLLELRSLLIIQHLQLHNTIPDFEPRFSEQWSRSTQEQLKHNKLRTQRTRFIQ